MTRSKRGALALVLLVFLVVRAAALVTWGVREGGDAPIYLDAAHAWLAGEPMSFRAKAYLGYVGVIALSQALGLGLAAVVALQVLLALAATWGLWRLGQALGGPRVGLMAALLFAGNPELAKWECFILTDSLYISSVVLAILAIHLAASSPRRGLPWAILALGMSGLLRPHGWTLPPIAAVFWIWSWVRRPPARAAALVGAIAFFVCVGLLSSGNAIRGREPDVMLMRGEVIWSYAEGRRAMPQDVEPSGSHGWGSTVRYAARHPWPTASLMLRRVGVELLHGRPFYSPLHNLLCLVLLPIYGLALFGAWAARSMPLSWLCSLVIAAHLALVALSYADWDGRFLLYALPAIGLLAATGAARLSGRRSRAFMGIEAIVDPRSS